MKANSRASGHRLSRRLSIKQRRKALCPEAIQYIPHGGIPLNKNRWKLYGVLYFALIFTVVPTLASAYIDPSVTTYAIQAIAGVAVAAGAFFATYGRRMKKSWMKTVGLDENDTKETEPPLEVTREDLKTELTASRENRTAAAPAAKKSGKDLKGRIITSVLCGLTPATALILRPILTFYISNEGEFWFKLQDILPDVLLVFFIAAVFAFLVHFLLPDGRKLSLRLWFAAAVTAVTLCAFIQDHFLSGYLPALTGEEIDWSIYSSWNTVSLALWGGIFLLLLVLLIVRPRIMKGSVYALLGLILVSEVVVGTVDIAAAKHDSKRTGTYFTQEGMYETSAAGNVVVLVTDTFEGTYMNEILEKYPDCKDYLQDVTYYDNTSGISVFTYFSYPKILTGQDFPLGKTFVDGAAYAFETETLISEVYNKGWEIGYYTEFAPTPNVKDKIISYGEEELHPNRQARIDILKYLIKGVLFRSMPQMLKPRFAVTTLDFEYAKFNLEGAGAPFIINDGVYFENLKEKGLTKVEGKPRFNVTELFGVHEPCTPNLEMYTTDEWNSLSVHEQQLATGYSQLKLLRTYLDKLKEAGTYDNTTVIMIADHGRDFRFYPICLVKEAGRQADGFRIDHTELALNDDYPGLITGMMDGASFSDIATAAAASGRPRTGLDFRAPNFGAKVFSRSEVTIQGIPNAWRNCVITHDDFALDDDFPGRCRLNQPFVKGRKATGNSVAVYGIEDGEIPGHSVVFDTFFDKAEKRSLVFRAKVTNITDSHQTIEFTLNGEPVGEPVFLEVGSGDVEIEIPLPETDTDRLTFQLNFPEAAKVYNPLWSIYHSVAIIEAEWITR